jgi:predicted nucleic acid-binding protein
MAIVCIDTQILYWAIVKNSKSSDQHFIKLAADFMKWLDDQDHDVLIPTIVVGEMLIPVPEDLRSKVLMQFRENWMIVDYDLRAASIFAKLRSDQLTKQRFKALQELHPPLTRKELLADLMIIATAIANDAAILYSHDKPLRSMAAGYLDARDFLDENFQMSMNLPETDE